jgi:hypothetical protein
MIASLGDKSGRVNTYMFAANAVTPTSPAVKWKQVKAKSIGSDGQQQQHESPSSSSSAGALRFIGCFHLIPPAILLSVLLGGVGSVGVSLALAALESFSSNNQLGASLLSCVRGETARACFSPVILAPDFSQLISLLSSSSISLQDQRQLLHRDGRLNI